MDLALVRAYVAGWKPAVDWALLYDDGIEHMIARIGALVAFLRTGSGARKMLESSQKVASALPRLSLLGIFVLIIDFVIIDKGQ